MGKPKYYAIRVGRRTGVFQGGWDEIRVHVDGFSGAVFKSFRSESEARAFLGNTSTSLPSHLTTSSNDAQMRGLRAGPRDTSISPPIYQSSLTVGGDLRQLSDPQVIGLKRSLSESNASSESLRYPKCHCGTKTVLRTVLKDNPNKGREFFTCRGSHCKFFEFKDGKRSFVTATVNKHIPIDPETVIIYTDGSCVGNYNVKEKVHPAGWGIVVITGGDGRRDASAVLVDERHGPVELNPQSEQYLGATVTSNNTAELSAIGQALKYVLDKYTSLMEIPHIVIRYDSEYAASSVVGLFNGNDCRLRMQS